MNMVDINGIIGIGGGIIGTIGGTLGIFSWFSNSTEKNRTFNKELFEKEIKLTYAECFDNSHLVETDGVNFYKIVSLINLIAKFQEKENSFKGLRVKCNFKKISKPAKHIKKNLNQFFGFNEAVQEPANGAGVTHHYETHKKEVIELKEKYAAFHKSIFEYN